MKIYILHVLVEPKVKKQVDIMNEIVQQVEKDGQETIICPVRNSTKHEVIKPAGLALFPACLTEGTGRLVFEIALPTRKDLGRRWFLKRLEGDRHKTFQLVATGDVAVIHVEIE